MSERDGFTIPEVGGALRHLTARFGARPGAHDPDVAARLTAAVARSARSALADRLAALLAEAAARCRPAVALLPEDVGPELHRMPSDLAREARRLAARLATSPATSPAMSLEVALPEDVTAPLPEDPKGCRTRAERLMEVLEQLEGQSVRVTDAHLRFVRAGR